MAPATRAELPAMTEQTTPKTMSSRLMTMKFMQRGAAATAAAASASGANSPATPKTDNEGNSTKRRKTNHTPTASTPVTPLYDQKMLQAALEEEDRKRKAAVEKRAAELGDSHWVLDGVAALSKGGPHQPLNVVQVGFAQIDHSATASDSPDGASLGAVNASAAGHFLRFNMKTSKACSFSSPRQGTESSSKEDNDNSESESSEEDSDEDQSSPESTGEEPDRGGRNDARQTPAKRARSSASAVLTKRSEERKKAQLLAKERRKKEVKLNTLTSISSSRTPPSFQQRSSSAQSCHGCGKFGHKVAECPNKKKR
ncbi:hypothetical protein B0T26DRAFT_851824 [Lasiosphaeria miniovina]|uniref:CCHC-type domain-containing protein n=1 Tax=Lasiosphaeria miniovina TaxID=1954250 RepID=A0AA40E0S5_9PEZI|nr:uncharacterized protein B0T26DRAFT_851824 [Lasiosphaeria miniovina]KAK0722765.1 hypothetical protein B0T26DRAFT_851824 [Lasiosphaeria miniovina]